MRDVEQADLDAGQFPPVLAIYERQGEKYAAKAKAV
jgi:hypothetical protein